MNIGNIHFNCERYIEALEAYSEGLVQVNYEMSLYEESF